MAELVIRSAKLYPASRAAGSASLATAFIHEPDSQQQKIGELFAVIEILSTANDPEKVADLIVEAFGKAFYSESEVENEGETDTAARFDLAVKAVNQELAHYTGHEDATWIGKTSAILAVASGSELHITHTGSAEAYLLRKNKLAKIDAGDREHHHQTHKPFTNIASGQLEAGDRLLLATPALMRILSRHEISDILAESSANAAANKIADRIEAETGAERVAAVVGEATTAEMVSEEPLPSEAPVVVHGSRESRLDGIKAKAIPFLQTSHQKAKPLAGKAADVTRRGWHFTKTRIAPGARRHSLRFVGWLRAKLRDPRQSKFVLAGALAIAVVAIFLVFGVIANGSQKKLITQYDKALAEARSGQQLWLQGDKQKAEATLLAAQSDLQTLEKSHPGKRLDSALKKRKHDAFDPASYTGLKNMVQDLLDQIAGLTRTSPKAFVVFKDGNPAFLELVGKNLVVIGGDTVPTIATIDIGSKKVSVSSKDTKSVGKVVATAASENGVFLLTAKPSVWLFKPSDGSLTEQDGAWVKGKAIASYNGNIYVLREDSSQVLRFFGSGDNSFGDPTNYVTSGADNLAGTNALVVDGSVVAAGGSQIERFFTGSFAQKSGKLPDELKDIDQIRSYSDGGLFLVRDGSTGRIGTLTFDSSVISFAKQYELSGNKDLRSFASADAVTVYALDKDKIVTFSLAP